MSGDNEYLVKLNKNTGAEVTSRQVDLPFEHIAYLSYAANVNLLVAVGSRGEYYTYENRAFNMSNLSPTWSSSFYEGSRLGSHGEQDQHPCIVGNMMYLRKYQVELNNNGNVTEFPLSRTGCGTQSGSTTHLFARNTNPCLYELPNGTPVKMTNGYESRPGCWINIIPVGGLVLIPEASSGCTCDYQLQTSMSFIPY